MPELPNVDCHPAKPGFLPTSMAPGQTGGRWQLAPGLYTFTKIRFR